MQPQSIYQYFLLIGLWLFTSFFTSNSFANSAIFLSHESFEYSITPYLSIYEDTTKELGIDDISSLEYLLLFSPSHAKTIKLGISDSYFWFRFSVTNPYEQPMRAVFSLSDSDFDLINFYLLRTDNNHLHYSSEHLDRAIKGGLLQKHSLQIEVPVGSTNTYLLQVHSKGLITSLASIQSVDKYILNEQKLFSILGISFGLLVGSALFFIYACFTYRLSISIPALGLVCILALYQLAAFGFLEVMTNISALYADKISELTLGLIGFLHLSTILSLRWVSHQRLLRTIIFAVIVSIMPITIIVMLIMPVAAMPIIATLLFTVNIIAVLILFFATSTNIVSQRWLRFGHSFTAIGILVTLLTSLNLLSFDSFTTWSQVIVPITIMLFLVAGTLAQIPRLRAINRNQNFGHLPLQHFLAKQVSEELLTPVNNILGVSDLLKDTQLRPKQTELNSTLSESGHELLHIVNQINDIGCLYSGEIKLNKEPVNLLELVNLSLSELQQEASRKKVELILDYCAELPTIINSDPSRLFIIIHNILKRALTYTEHGEINVSVQPLPVQSGFGVLIQVQLSTTIIRPDELKNSFSILQHQDSLPTNGNYEWHLLLTRFLINKMDARLEVESMTLQGASLSLTITFPKESVPEQPIASSGILNGKQLLIVDDNASLRSVLEKQTKRWGLRVNSTYNSKEALALLRNQINLGDPYDFLVLDQDMPALDGFELAKHIQQDTSIQPKPAMIMLANHSVNEITEEAYNAGIAIVLAKPVYPEHLQQALQDLLPATHTVNRGK